MIAANLNWLFTEHAMAHRFAAARAAGFDGVEILKPYDHDPEMLKQAADAAKLAFVLINTPFNANTIGTAALPDHRQQFQADFTRALETARCLNCPRIHVMAGKAQGPDAFEAFVQNLTWAADAAGDTHITIEPLNPTDQPGYFLSDFETAAKAIHTLNAPNLGLQFDIYHAQMIDDPLALWQTYGPLTTHIQLGGAPGRCEPHRGELNLAAFAKAIAAMGYKGAISAEYRPDAETEDGLDWMKIFKESAKT